NGGERLLGGRSAAAGSGRICRRTGAAAKCGGAANAADNSGRADADDVGRLQRDGGAGALVSRTPEIRGSVQWLQIMPPQSLPIYTDDRHRGGGHPPTPATPPCV